MILVRNFFGLVFSHELRVGFSVKKIATLKQCVNWVDI